MNPESGNNNDYQNENENQLHQESDFQADNHFQPHPSNDLFRPKLQKFNGFDKSVTIENWLKLYENAARRYHWSEEKMIDLLGEYLEKEALNHYLNSNNINNWPGIKSTLTTRFGVKTVEPIVEFDRLKYQHTKNFEEYYENKRRLANLAQLTESQAVPLMIEHLTEDLKRCFIGHRATTYSQFFDIAKTAEHHFPRNNNNNFFKNQFKEKKKFNEQNFGPKSIEHDRFKQKKQPGPCYRCIQAGKPNQLHWSSECPLKKSNDYQPKVNFVGQGPINEPTNDQNPGCSNHNFQSNEHNLN